MKTLAIISTLILSTAVISWTILNNKPAPASVATDGNSKTSQELQALRNQITTLSEQLAQANTALIQMAQNTQRQPNEKAADGSYAFYPEQETLLAGAPPPPLSPDEQRERAKRPQVMMVNPTPVQQENYEVLKAQLNDLAFVSNINLQEFASLPDVQNLPKPLQMVLTSKLIEQYNRGNISEETFLGTELMKHQNQ